MQSAPPWIARACITPAFRRFGTGTNEVLIDLALQETSEQALDKGKIQIINALETNVPAGKQDLNNTSNLTLTNYLMDRDPLHAGTDASQRYAAHAQAIIDYKRQDKGRRAKFYGRSKGSCRSCGVGFGPEGFFVSNFGVRNVAIVGPQVGSQLQKQAFLGDCLFVGRNADLSGISL